ncbi:MAG TPA: hypothetical protein VNM37_16745 [Candidatus Dormibacteraeota bacterium]|nr:hypothetical protein [Candidatus Dormibacteraeota bacterium]
MTATIISTQGNYTFGAMTNQTISRIIATNTQMLRLKEAIATASSGYTGEPGTEFEAPASGNLGPPTNATNLFGVVPSDTPGEQGQAYSYAVGALHDAWAAFWTAAAPYIEQLDNGGTSM